jgi:hypothetical protein
VISGRASKQALWKGEKLARGTQLPFSTKPESTAIFEPSTHQKQIARQLYALSQSPHPVFALPHSVSDARHKPRVGLVSQAFPQLPAAAS